MVDLQCTSQCKKQAGKVPQTDIDPLQENLQRGAHNSEGECLQGDIRDQLIVRVVSKVLRN